MPLKSSVFSFRLEPDLDEELSRTAEAMDISRSQVVTRAVRHFLARQRHIDSVLEEARSAYANFSATGQGVAWEEAAAWMAEGGMSQAPPLKDLRRR